MRTAPLLLALLLTTTVAAADPVITSVTPSSGPVTGGTPVVIRGTGFSNVCVTCLGPLAPAVHFGTIRALSVEFIDATELRAVTPRHLPGLVSVTVTQHDDSPPNQSTLQNAFEFTGGVEQAFDPILFPIFSPPVHGQHGTEFRTIAKLWNNGLNTVEVYGFDSTCLPLADPPIFPTVPLPVTPRGGEIELETDCSDTAGRMFFVPQGDRSIVASLRVQEMTRQSENHGVEMPVVRRKDFSHDSIALLGVPNDPKFRLTLRIYTLNDAGPVYVTILARNGEVVAFDQLSGPPPSRDPFEPRYIAFTDFPPPAVLNDDEMTVVVELQPEGVGTPIVTRLIWAFITVTNNETQHITTVTPQQE